MRIIALLLLLAVSTQAATYYVDYAGGSDANAGTSTGAAWKRAPSMTGFTGSYSHTAGDTFKFKGGVTWTSNCFPWTIGNSGSAGNVDTYTVDATWYTGGAWSQPVFDANHTEPAGGLVAATTKSYLTFNNLAFINHGTSGASGTSLNMLNFEDCHNIAFTLLTVTPYCQRAFYVHWNTSGVYSNFTFTSNTVSHCASMLWFASGSAGVTNVNLNIKNNLLFDCASQIGNSVHGDGFLHAFGAAGFFITNLVFSSNTATGDFRRSFGADGAMTAFFFLEGGTYFGSLFNNSFAPYPVTNSMFESFVTITATGGSLSFHNNSFANIGVNSASAGILLGNVGGTIILRNNIVSGLQYAIFASSTNTSYTFEKNIWNSNSGQLAWGPDPTLQSYATWQAAGRDVNSLLGSDPLWVSAPSNLALATNSPALNVATNLNAQFTTDILGATRGSVWDIGAYEGGTSAPPATVSPPVFLRIQ
ncbi:MAG: choice-of-anchor Q domain-containing protein [Verrucomicrobiota bacterium]